MYGPSLIVSSSKSRNKQERKKITASEKVQDKYEVLDEATSDKYEAPRPRAAKQISFPVPASSHGTTTIIVRVGAGPTLQPFSIHRDLLCKASPYFASRLSGDFQDGSKDELNLDDECPLAFEVLYQYLYSGEVLRAGFYTQSRVEDDVLWLRAYKLADRRMVEGLQKISYEKLKGIFSVNERTVPSRRFIEELFSDDGDNCVQLRCYAIAHTAYWIMNDSSGDWREWGAVLVRKGDYGVAVAVQLAKIRSEAHDGWSSHPSEDPDFEDYRSTERVEEKFVLETSDSHSEDAAEADRLEQIDVEQD